MLDFIYHNNYDTKTALLSHFLARKRQKVNEYDQEIPQLHTADQPTAPRGRATIAII